MHAATLFLASLAGASLASHSLSPRDLALVNTVLSEVGFDFIALSQAVENFTDDISAIKSASDTLVEAFAAGTAEITNSEPLTLAETSSLERSVPQLQSQARALADDLIDKKNALQAAGACADVKDVLDEVEDGGKALVAALVDKVPEDVKAGAQRIGEGFVMELGQARKYFPGEECARGDGVRIGGLGDDIGAATAGGEEGEEDGGARVGAGGWIWGVVLMGGLVAAW